MKYPHSSASSGQSAAPRPAARARAFWNLRMSPIVSARFAASSRVTRLLDVPDAARVLATHDRADLLASGWFEDMVEFAAVPAEPVKKASGEEMEGPSPRSAINPPG